jgi:PRTRC genetic system protein C
MARRFIYDGQELGDPDPKMSIEEVRQTHAVFLGELYNATHTEKKDGEDTIITFTKRVGTKGAWPEFCQPGWCAVEKRNYGSYENIEFELQDNSTKADAALLTKAAEWVKKNPDYTLLTIALNHRYTEGPFNTILILFVEG